MAWYIVDVRCPRCGKLHRLSGQHQIPDGPRRPGSLAELYGSGPLPPMLATLLKDLVWCRATKEWINQTVRTEVFLTPRPS